MLNTNASHNSNIDSTTEDRSCQDCIYCQRCENDVADLLLCGNYVSNDHDSGKECLWQEMSYRRYVETVLDCQQDDELDSNEL